MYVRNLLGEVEEKNMITCQGKSVFSGVAIGKIFVYKKADNTIEQYHSHNTERLDVEGMKNLLLKLKLFGGQY